MILTVFLAGMFAGLVWVWLASLVGRFLSRYNPETQKAQSHLNEVNKRLRILQWKNVLAASKEYHNHWNNQK